MKLKGNDIIVMINQSGEDVAIGYGTSCELDVKAETIEVSSPDSGRWVRRKKKKIRWTGSSGHILSDNGQAQVLLSLVPSTKKVQILVGSVKEHKEPLNSSDYEADGRFAFKGYALLTRATITANRGSTATLSIEFEGSGEAVMDKDQELPDDNDNNEGGGGGDGGATTLGELLNVAGNVDNIASEDRILYEEAGSGLWTWKAASEIMPDIDKIKSQMLDTFLRKDQDDRTPYGLTVGGILTAEEQLQIGTFVKSLVAGMGAGIDSDGNAEFQSVRVRGSFTAWEYVVNRLAALEGDTVFTEIDTVDEAKDLGNGCYGLTLRSKWDGYFTAMTENTVLRGKMNTLSKGSGEYYEAFYRVNAVNASANYIEVVMYPDDEVPDGVNYPPCASMNISRWGHQTDETRQRCLYITDEGVIRRLRRVTKPILEDFNYGFILGDMPTFIKELNPDLIVDGEDYLYARGIVVSNFIEVDPIGKPVPSYVDRGPYDASADYYAGDYREETGKYEVSDVWYNGCKWRCQKTGTTTAPAWNVTDWAMIEGNVDFTVSFEELEQLYDPDNFHATLTIAAKLYNVNIIDDVPVENIEWTRYTEDLDGSPRTDSDNIWDTEHAGTGKQLSLSWDDLDADTYMPTVIRFTATVTIRDGMTDSAVFEMD